MDTGLDNGFIANVTRETFFKQIALSALSLCPAGFGVRRKTLGNVNFNRFKNLLPGNITRKFLLPTGQGIVVRLPLG